jgi:hypothetical protein
MKVRALFINFSDTEGPLIDVRFTLNADMIEHLRDVRFVPKADSCSAANLRLFDHLVGAGEQRRWDIDAKRTCSLQIEDEFKFGRLQNR